MGATSRTGEIHGSQEETYQETPEGQENGTDQTATKVEWC
jgi:hypothetical protein